MEHDTKSSTSAFLAHFISGKSFEFARIKEGFDRSKFKPLKVFGQDEIRMNFQWGSNEGLIPTQRPGTDIDQEMIKRLVRHGIFHLRDNLALMVSPAVHKRLGAYTSYSSKVLLFERVRPQ
ncbi:MAG: hypothetical protein QG551_248 [Patescibacteria group bacterium]|mgnify:FL=1|jgi:hypothetical protein|nr:hypothetical protein [Patescibacteria group bacterium]